MGHAPDEATGELLCHCKTLPLFCANLRLTSCVLVVERSVSINLSTCNFSSAVSLTVSCTNPMYAVNSMFCIASGAS